MKICVRDSADVVDVVCFAVNEIVSIPERSGERVWPTSDGDQIGLFQFVVPPDIPREMATLDELREFYCSVLPEAHKLVEIRLVKIDKLGAVRLITKAPQQQTGFAYRGSLTFPFAKGSFVFTVDCKEGSPTGVREAILADKMFRSGCSVEEVLFAGPAFDLAENDENFPDHPVARARRILGELEQSITFAKSIKAQKPFPLPTEKESPWSLLRRWLYPRGKH